VVAGLNLNGVVWRLVSNQDDEIGGAVPTGTIIYTNVSSRISANKATQALLEQGLEVPETFTAVLFPGNINIRINDQYQVTAPAISTYYQKKFVIINIQPSSMMDSRQYLLVTLRRLEIANSANLQ
jgi:hypothetical protein